MTEHHAGNCTDPYCPRHGDLYEGDPARIKREPLPRLTSTEERKMARSITVHHCASGQEYAPGSFESCSKCNPPSKEQLAKALEYYFERPVTEAEVDDWLDALDSNPEIDMAEYVAAVLAL